MNILRRISVPTGDILIVQGEYGPLECLSLGDYGKDVNIKCDAMGLSRVPSPVRHTKLLPLSEKWVVTVSTQYGCSMGCSFCDVPKVGPGRNATFSDLIRQVSESLDLHPEVMGTSRLNLHYARMGEPTWNPAVIESAIWLHGSVSQRGSVFHPVVSTMMPAGNAQLIDFISRWMRVKNDICQGNAGLQLSINSTDPLERRTMFGGNSMTVEQIGSIMRRMPRPVGRKITLNFAVAGYKVDPRMLARYFGPEWYICKLTPMHRTEAASENGILTRGDYTTYEPYEELEGRLKAVGYDVLVFIASREEDEGRITCGNAILSGSEPFGAAQQKGGA